MKMKNTIVLVEDFNIDILREAFRQGRLYIRTEAKSAKSIREEGIQTILQYVSRIHACAYQAYASTSCGKQFFIPPSWATSSS